MRTHESALLLAILGLAGLGGLASAQCPLPDGLDGGACGTNVRPSLPAFTGFWQEALGVGWASCEARAIEGCTAEWTLIPVLPAAGSDPALRFAKLELLDASGARLWQGRLRLVYSRTWLETDGLGETLQVWRFLVNGDLELGPAAGSTSLPVPACAPAHGNRAHFTGYMDRAWSCASGRWETAWMLTHAIDRIDHAPGFPRAGDFHPDEAFSFVGPAAGFEVDGPAEVEAAFPHESVSESLRRLVLPPHGSGGAVAYGSEEPLVLALAPRFEMCPSSAGRRAQYYVGDLSIAGACGTRASTVAGSSLLPGFLSMRIGRWTEGASFPGREDLRWNAGSYVYTDPVTGSTRQEVFFGVTTGRGFAARQLLSTGPGASLPHRFLDQANSLSGAHVIVMNVPHASDHVLNLNLEDASYPPDPPCADCGGTGY